MPDFVVIFVADGKLNAVQGPNANKTFTSASGDGANGLAAISIGSNGLYVSFPVSGAQQASYTTDTGINNANLVFAALATGVGGNAIRIRYVLSGANTPLSIVVAGTDITVNLGTNGSSVATSTANAIKAAIQASTAASALISVANAANNDGTGIPNAAIPYTNLGGGFNGGSTASQVVVAPAATPSPGVF